MSPINHHHPHPASIDCGVFIHSPISLGWGAFPHQGGKGQVINEDPKQRADKRIMFPSRYLEGQCPCGVKLLDIETAQPKLLVQTGGPLRAHTTGADRNLVPALLESPYKETPFFLDCVNSLGSWRIWGEECNLSH